MFQSLRRCFLNILRNEEGLTAVEYAVALGLIIVVCIGAIALIGTNMGSSFTSAAPTTTGP